MDRQPVATVLVIPICWLLEFFFAGQFLDVLVEILFPFLCLTGWY
jgi:hypothetical protein